MDFDETWRQKMAGKSADTYSIETVEELELFDSSALAEPALDDVDEGEISGFVEWLARTPIGEYFFRGARGQQL